MQPTAATVSVSGNVLKNAKGVVVPNTNGLKGIRAAVAAGIICGDADRGMQVLGAVSDEQRAAVADFMNTVNIDVSCAETDCQLYISVTLYARTSYSRVVIVDNCSNIVEIMKNGESLLKRPIMMHHEGVSNDASCLNPHDIFVYANSVNIEEVQDLLDMQIDCNTAICEAGMNRKYGSDIGKILLQGNESDAMIVSKAYAVSGCEARMNGCELPAAILCGSGNQGIVASVPIIYHAKQFAIERERVYRALILSDLLTVCQNMSDGQLSVGCGVINAGCAVGAGVAYLLGGDENAVLQTLENAVSMTIDMNCDGAKPSCAAKIAAAIDTGFLGYRIYLRNAEG